MGREEMGEREGESTLMTCTGMACYNFCFMDGLQFFIEKTDCHIHMIQYSAV